MARHGSLLADDPAEYDAVDGFVLLGTGDWNRARQDLLLASLRAQPRPVLVGNPNLVSPREDGLAPEPGLYAHEIADLTVSVWPDRLSLLKTSYRTESLVFPLNAGYFLRHANDRLSPPRHSP